MSRAVRILMLTKCIFLTGSFLTFIGFSKGLAIASFLAKPQGARGWSIPNELITACTYTPVIMGVSLIFLAIIITAAMVINWINKSTSI